MGVNLGLSEYGLMVFENKVGTNIFGPEEDAITEGWRHVYNEVLYRGIKFKTLHAVTKPEATDSFLSSMYCSTDVSREIKSRRTSSAEHVAHMTDVRNAYKILAGNPERNRTSLSTFAWILGEY
jgi:hypothetical protein